MSTTSGLGRLSAFGRRCHFIPLIDIEDQDLTYNGQTLSIQFETGRQRAIHAAVKTSSSPCPPDKREGRAASGQALHVQSSTLTVVGDLKEVV
jgi:hypothetical protein